ncbi:hypothetical protein PPYR_10455 [Photinus pyralis]|uniref:UPAR/Ly6 domain-containing protein n=1 Tax=Photinus pyralis TaxID=7054 RepID=A0A5N4AGF4_PHOPY|nr:hypothetical protein PPYR_10455 [Photinus pyralis]
MSIPTMYFKLLVLVSVGLLCISVVSGHTNRYCNFCYGESNGSSPDFSNCRNFVNVTKVYDCTSNHYCVSFHETVKTDKATYTVAKRTCSNDCAWYKKKGRADLHCSQCETDYCNKEKF